MGILLNFLAITTQMEVTKTAKTESFAIFALANSSNKRIKNTIKTCQKSDICSGNSLKKIQQNVGRTDDLKDIN